MAGVRLNSKFQLLDQLGLIVNNEIAHEYQKIIPGQLNEQEIVNRLRQYIDDETITNNLSSLANIALNITEDCNFRCDYCNYSGSYENERKHRKKSIDFQIAMDAVDFFFTLAENPRRSRKFNIINISFFGGEPLLEFPLLKKIISGAEALSMPCTENTPIIFAIK